MIHFLGCIMNGNFYALCGVMIDYCYTSNPGEVTCYKCKKHLEDVIYVIPTQRQ